MSVDPATVDKIAALARLQLSDEERRVLGPQLARIIEYVEQLADVDVTGVPAMQHAVALANVTRADAQGACLSQTDALANAPEADEGHFLVPPVLPTE